MRSAGLDPVLRPGEALGAVTRAARLGGVVLTETAYPAAAALAEHRHESFYFFLVLAAGFWSGPPPRSPPWAR